MTRSRYSRSSAENARLIELGESSNELNGIEINLLDTIPRGGLERDKELLCNMIVRIVRAELSHEKDRIMFIQSLDEGLRSAAEGMLGVSPTLVETLWDGNRHLLPESELRGGLTLKPSSSFAALEPREDFVFPYPPIIPKELR